MNKSKMYVLVRKRAPKGHGVNAVGHVVLKCFLKYQKDQDMKSWIKHSFKKVTCLVSDREFRRAKNAGHYVIFEEDDLNDMVCAMAFRPREKYPYYFKDFRLYA